MLKQTKTVQTEVLGHDWSEPEYTRSEDNRRVVARRVCRNDEADVESVTVETAQEETASTCEQTGRITYTAEFKNPAFAKQIKTIAIEVLRCGDVNSDVDVADALIIMRYDSGLIDSLQ